MNQIEILEKEIEICHMENVQLNSILENDAYINQFMEDGDNKSEGIFQRLKNQLMKLFEKIKDFFKKHSSAAEDEKMRKELEKVEKAKLTAIDGHKVFKHSKKYQDKIKNAKSVEEVDKIVDDYKKTTKKLTAAGAFALIFTRTGLAVYEKRKANRKANFEAQERDYSVAMRWLNEAEVMSKDMSSLRNDNDHGKKIKLYTKSALSAVNTAEHCGKSITDDEIDLITRKARAIFTIADESIVMTQKKELINAAKTYDKDVSDIVADHINQTVDMIRSDARHDSEDAIERFVNNHKRNKQ